MFKKRIAFFRSIQFLGDLALVAVAWLAAYFLRFYTPLVPVTKGVPYLTLYLSLLLLVLGVFAVVLPMGGLYRRPWAGLGSLWWPVARGTTVGVVVSVTLTYFIQPYEFSRLVFLWFWVLITAGLLAFRPLLRRYWGRHVSGGYGEEALVVGVGELGRMVAQKLLRQPVLGVRVVGFLTQRPELVGTKVDGLPVLGLYSEVTQILATQQVNLVIIALPLSAHDRINDLLNLMADELVDIKVVPDLFRHVSLAGSVEEFEGLPFIGLRGSPLEGWARVAKRLTDILGSALGLAALSPLLLLLTALVKLSSPGRCSTGKAAWDWTAGSSPCTSSAPCASTPKRSAARSGPARTTPAAPGWAPSCARPAWMNCPSSSTCSRAR